MTEKEEAAILNDYLRWILKEESHCGKMETDIRDVIRRFENRQNRFLKNLMKEPKEDNK